MDPMDLVKGGLVRLSRAGYLMRKVRRPAARPSAPPRGAARAGARNILFITVDQQRYDAIGINGGRVARTPIIDGIARGGISFRRAHVQNVVCMPSRATMLTGQHPRTHGVIANGIPLPSDAPSVAEHLRVHAGYRTAMVGKAHFDPHLDPMMRFYENRCAAEGFVGPWHGFEHAELATHGPLAGHHYADWLWRNHPEDISGFGAVLTGAGGGETRAPEVAHNPIPREHYHTDWVADRTIEWLRGIDGSPFFCWMSFPDPHHPFDPPIDEVRARVDWREVPLPDRYLGGDDARRVLRQRPRHWLDWYEGRFRNPEGGPIAPIPGQLTEDQLREINAMIHVENELIDEAIGRVVAHLERAGLAETTDIFFTSDHGELQGDYGLLFKGPYHVESLLRVPLIWRPASSACIDPAEISDPVGHVDLAPTFCRVAGLEVPEWMEGRPLPVEHDESRRSVITTFDSQFAAVGMHLETIFADSMICTRYQPRTHDRGGRFRFYWSIWGRGSEIPSYTGTEGELYDLREDPLGMHNLWNDPSHRVRRDALIAELDATLPLERTPLLDVAAPT